MVRGNKLESELTVGVRSEFGGAWARYVPMTEPVTDCLHYLFIHFVTRSDPARLNDKTN